MAYYRHIAPLEKAEEVNHNDQPVYCDFGLIGRFLRKTIALAIAHLIGRLIVRKTIALAIRSLDRSVDCMGFAAGSTQPTLTSQFGGASGGQCGSG